MVDQNARNRIIRQQEQKSLISQLISSLKPIDKPDTTTEPLNRVADGVKREGNISTILVAFVQKILRVISDFKDSAVTPKDVREVKQAIQSLTFPSVEIPETVTLNSRQHKEIISSVKEIKFPEFPKFPQKMDVGIGDALLILEEIVKELGKSKKTEVTGQVNIGSMPEINLMPLLKAIREIKISVPREISKPSIIDMSGVLLALNELNENVIALTDVNNNTDVVKSLHTLNEGIGILIDKPTFVPPAVTHISLNALQGLVKTTTMTVSTSAVKLPTTNLTDRRSIQVYNNSSNILYIGGSDVTTVNGIPIPSSSFSQALDLGYNTNLYGITTGSSNIRVLEVSDESSGK